MLRKKIAVLVAAALMSLSASSAFAAFADLDLIRVVYERTTGTVEYATDLGNVNNIIANGGTFNGTTLSAATPNNLYVAYFAIDRSVAAAPKLWVSGSTDVTKAPVAVGKLGFTTTKSGMDSIYTYYNSLVADANNTVAAAQSTASSYRNKLSASQGALSNAITIATRVNTEAKLAGLVTGAATSVTQNLYYFANADTNNAKGVAVQNLSIITNADGSTTVTTTPIPAAFYLMGSGLLGLVGLRRRNKVA